MARIIITRDAEVLREVQLSQERMTIGRHRRNDIVLDHGAVSSDHAVIVTILDESFLEDLDSTNGTHVNGLQVAKHFMQPNDVITIAKFKLQFVAGKGATAGAAVPKPVIVSESPVRIPVAATPEPIPAAASLPLGNIEVLSGPNIGKRLALTKPLTTLGHPGIQVVVISRRPDGYFIVHIEGERQPLLNKEPVGSEPRAIHHGDVIDLSGTEMAFSLV